MLVYLLTIKMEIKKLQLLLSIIQDSKYAKTMNMMKSIDSKYLH